MFHRWGFLLTEIWGLLALAALLGLFVGWLIWGRRATVVADSSEADRLRASLAECTSRSKAIEGRLSAAEARANAAEARAEAAAAAATVGAATAAATAPAPLAALALPIASPPTAEVSPSASAAKAKPASLAAARDGKADDLKLIKGVGPKLEALCHKLGFFHFDQIANWTASEIAWVDENLEGFKGRVTRDEWVAQARDLAAGKPPRAGGEN